MRLFAIALLLVALTCMAGLLLGQAVHVLFEGESFPPMPMSTKEITFLRVPATSPISP